MASDAAGYKVNHDQPGFYRVKYLEHGDLQELGKRVENKELSPVDRWGLQNDLYALVRGGDFAIDDYLNFLSYYSREDSFLPLTSIAGNLFHAYLVMEGAKREKVASIGEGLLKKVLSDMGYEPNRDEKQTTSILRDQIIWHAVVYGSQDVAKFTMGKFISLMSGEIVHPYIMRSVMQVGALNGGTEVFKWFVKRLGSSESEHDRINILMALGNFKEKSLIEKTQQYVLHKVPNRNKFVPIGHMAANPYAIPHMWEWHMSNLDALEQFHPMHYGRVVGAIVPVCGIGKEAQIKSFFENYMSKKKKAKDVIKLSLEKLAINSRMRNS
ncbi:MAG: ERAP1-like C-terminal domain-containing protein [Desulfatiglandales bacterium]|nr:ERAP1-like C-terminal domain-containing protein [Desulfatiglandales bacterium]